MDTDAWTFIHASPSASASSASADGTLSVTATELAAYSPSCSFQRQLAHLYELLNFFSFALKDVGRASAPHWCSLDQECDMLIHDSFDVWHNTRAMRYFALFSQPLLLKHKEIFTAARMCSTERNTCFLKWCRRVHALREAHGTTTKHAAPSDDQETRCYKILGEGMLRDDLLPDQRNEPKYQIHYDSKGNVILSGKQRSWIAAMLRKNLGHKNVAYFILQHGLPELFDAPLRNEKPSQELLQNILEDGVHWHVSLLRSLIEHDQRPGLAHERQMSDLQQTAWRRQKQQAHLHAKQALAQGKRLCEDRDSRKRTYSEMSATEQQLLEDFDTNKLQKRVEQTSLRIEHIPFRGSLWNATEQPL